MSDYSLWHNDQEHYQDEKVYDNPSLLMMEYCGQAEVYRGKLNDHVGKGNKYFEKRGKKKYRYVGDVIYCRKICEKLGKDLKIYPVFMLVIEKKPEILLEYKKDAARHFGWNPKANWVAGIIRHTPANE